jgi:hypothetical protein
VKTKVKTKTTEPKLTHWVVEATLDDDGDTRKKAKAKCKRLNKKLLKEAEEQLIRGKRFVEFLKRVLSKPVKVWEAMYTENMRPITPLPGEEVKYRVFGMYDRPVNKD